MYIEPSWMRLGFSEPPDRFPGKGIGVIIIDDISSHPTIRHLANRLKHVVVENDSITCSDIANQNFNPSLLDKGTHGLMTVLTLKPPTAKYSPLITKDWSASYPLSR